MHPKVNTEHVARREDVLDLYAKEPSIDNRATLDREIAAWTAARNAAGARIRWMFTVERARENLGRAHAKWTPEVMNAAA